MRRREPGPEDGTPFTSAKRERQKKKKKKKTKKTEKDTIDRKEVTQMHSRRQGHDSKATGPEEGTFCLKVI